LPVRDEMPWTYLRVNSKCSRVLIKTAMFAVNAPRAVASEDSAGKMAVRHGGVKARDAAAAVATSASRSKKQMSEAGVVLAIVSRR